METYYKNKKAETAGEYTFDETNKMVEGVNANGEQSIYSYNGLGALMENTWIIAKNGYGYHDVSATAVVDGEVVVDVDTGKRQQKVRLTPEELEAANAAEDTAIAAAAAEAEKAEEAAASDDETESAAEVANPPMLLTAGNQVNGNETQDKPTGSDVKKTSTVVKEFVVDFSREDYRPLIEYEVNGLTYRYVNSDKARLSVVVQGIETGSSSLLDEKGELHAYCHTDYLGTTDYLTSAVNSKVISWTSYNEWGEITHNAVLKCGKRELDLVKEYATHDYDAVLDLYYAKARFYDAYNRRFVSVDPILDPSQYDLREYVTDSMQLVQYLYVSNGPLTKIDIVGLKEVLLSMITSQYGGTVEYIENDTPFVSFGGRGGKAYGEYSIAYKKEDGRYYVDDDEFVDEWGIKDSISQYSPLLSGTVRFVIFERYDLYNRAEYYERLTVCGTEVKYSKIYDNTYTHHGIRDTIDVSEIGYDEYDFYNGGFWFDFTNALSDLGHPVIGNALGFIDVSKDVSLNDIRIAKKKAWSFSHYYYINDEKELVVESNLGELLFF